MRLKKLACVILLIFISACSFNNYTNIYEQDLKFIYKQIKENHPGVYNTEDKSFNNNLEQAYHQSLQKIKSSFSQKEQRKTIEEFAKSFGDHHLWVGWYNQPRNAGQITNKSLGLNYLTSEIIWITLPSFDLSKEQQQQFQQIINQLSKLNNKKAIIFDLRGNSGGNSFYGSQITDHLFGKDYAENKRKQYQKDIYVDWRASKDNYEYITNLTGKFTKNFGQNSAETQWIRKINNGLRQSLLAGKNYYREYQEVVSTKQVNANLNSHLIAIIDNACFSSCLDFLDELKAMQISITLIGKPTRADRIYMEARTVSLPSGEGKFIFPIKVYRNRPRGDNIPYYPDINYPHDINNNQKLEEFVLKHLFVKESN